MKTMNYIKIGIASSILSIAAGCTSFLEEDLKSSLAPDNTYTSSLGFEVGATGLYAIARSEYNTWGENGAFMHNGACAYEVLYHDKDVRGVVTELMTRAKKDELLETAWL